VTATWANSDPGDTGKEAMEIDEPDVVVDRGVESTEIDYTSTASLITLGTKGTDSTEMDDESLG